MNFADILTVTRGPIQNVNIVLDEQACIRIHSIDRARNLFYAKYYSKDSFTNRYVRMYQHLYVFDIKEFYDNEVFYGELEEKEKEVL